MLIQGQVGPAAGFASLGPATQATVRLGNLGDLVASELQGRYYELAYRRQLFRASSQAGSVTTVGLAWRRQRIADEQRWADDGGRL